MKNLSKFVDVLSKGEYSPQEVCLQLAKTDPELFLQLVELTNIKRQDLPMWVKPVTHEIRYVGFIQSIKLLRQHTGLGLKEAKETVENLINYRLHVLGERSHYDVSHKSNNELSQDCAKIFDVVCEGFARY